MLAYEKNDTSVLWQSYFESRSLEVRNQIIVKYLGLVKNIVMRMMPVYHNYNEYDDLVSCGVMGLMDAIDKFDISKEVKFETYATLRIRGEILDHMRRQDWAPSSLRRRINEISEARKQLESQMNRFPTNQELAQHLHIELDDLEKILNKTHMFNLMYFEDLVSSNANANYNDVLESSDDQPEDNAEKTELKEILLQMIEDMPEKERLVITLYYYEDLNLKEIAQILKVSESRVSQIHSKVLGNLRQKMKAEFTESY